MTAVFVHSIWRTTRSYSHAIASLAAVLKDNIAGLDMHVVTVRTKDDELYASEILSFKPDVIFFTAMSNQWHLIVSLASLVSEYDEAPLLVCGGIHLTARPHSELRKVFHVILIGEGESHISEIIQRRDVLKLESRQLGSPVTIMGEPLQDLSQLPVPCISVFERDDILAYPSVMFSRGCPYKCNYCMSRNGGLTSSVRWKPTTKAVEEIEKLVAYCSPATVYIDDDTLLKNPKWLAEFCPVYLHRVGIPFICNARPETVKLAVAKMLREAGCEAIGIGIESGSPSIRERLGRPMSDEKIVDAFRTAKSVGLSTWSFNMVGLPGELPEDLEKTIALNDLAEVDNVRVSIYTPYPGAPMGQTVEIGESGYFRSPDSLSKPMRDLYVEWITQLDKSGRLWLTNTERQLVLESVAVAS